MGRKDGLFSIYKKKWGGAERRFGCDSISPKGIMDNVMPVSLVGQQGIIDDADKVLIS